MRREVEIKLTPKELAEQFWNMGSDEQAEVFSYMYKEAGSHKLMMQFLGVRDECEKMKKHGDDSALNGFQYMFASAFKYMSEGM